MNQAQSQGPPVVAEAVTKKFGQGKAAVRAVGGVSLEVAAGEHVAVIGPSGSGKTTLLHMMAGLASPDAGRVVIGGRDLADMNDRALTLFRRRNIGIVFQAYNLVPTLSVEDNIRLPLLLGGGGDTGDDAVPALLETLGLAGRRKHRPDQLSGGEQQRVAIGRAMITGPAVILADEPTGNIDSASGQRLCELMSDLCNQRGRSIVTVTHDPAVAAWADRVVVLRDGQMVASAAGSAFASARELGSWFLDVLEQSPEANRCA